MNQKNFNSFYDFQVWFDDNYDYDPNTREFFIFYKDEQYRNENLYRMRNEVYDAAGFPEAEREEEEQDYEPDFDGNDDRDYDSGLSYSQQCWQDRSDLASEQLSRGHIDPIQAAEIRMGA